jgi:radical SAM superfamily enzyme YgiQ (UPF0313 family)
MKILLAHPEPIIWQQSKTLPLGIAYIASYLEEAGYQVSCLDLSVEPERVLPKADLVGITATTPLIYGAWKIAEKAKQNGALTVLGGPHVTCLPDESLERKEVDYVIRGEGEETMLALVRALENDKDCGGILGLSFKRKGRIIHNSPRPLIQSIDGLPHPARHLFPSLERYTNPQPLLSTRSPAANIITSRGCPYNCYFCYKGVFGRIWRPRSPEDVVQEWRQLVNQYRVAEIGIQDDIFNTDIKRVNKICDLIMEENLVVPWSTPNGLRADILTKEVLRKMKKAGCYRLAFGIESGNQKMLGEKIGKKINLKKVHQAIRLCRQEGITTIGFFIIGHPWDTKETVKETLEFAKDTDLDYAQFTIATPIPGSRLREFVENDGQLRDLNWTDYDHYTAGSYFEFGEINDEFIKWAKKYTWRGFYLRPRFLVRKLLDRNIWNNLSNLMVGIREFLMKR